MRTGGCRTSVADGRAAVRERQGARQGFALAFSGALLVLPCVSASAALEILHTYSEPITGSLKVRG
jgi:hypothetical protein